MIADYLPYYVLIFFENYRYVIYQTYSAADSESNIGVKVIDIKTNKTSPTCSYLEASRIFDINYKSANLKLYMCTLSWNVHIGQYSSINTFTSCQNSKGVISITVQILFFSQLVTINVFWEEDAIYFYIFFLQISSLKLTHQKVIGVTKGTIINVYVIDIYVILQKIALLAIDLDWKFWLPNFIFMPSPQH